MKVICAGFPKTGTKSLKTALKSLGYTVYDYSENMLYYSEDWRRILDRGWNFQDFQAMYGNIDAVCDAPACYFWDEILKAFPDAKVILSTRKTEDEWISSTKRQLEILRNNRFLATAKFLSPTFSRILRTQSSLERVIFGLSLESWGDAGWNEAILRKKYREHNSYVANNAPRERLLIYQCTEGWKPLCEFLNVAEPTDRLFPHVNIKGELLAQNMDKDPMILTVRKEIMRAIIAAFATVIFLMFALMTAIL